MLLWQLDCDLLQDLSVVTLKSSVQSTVTVDNDEAELLVVLKKEVKWTGVELVPAVI